jgi:hypothetical protein
LRQLAGKQLTHRALDELPAGKPAEHLRSVPVAIGTLPPRDEQLSRPERWTARVIAERPGTGQQQLLHRYAVWHVTRRLRGRLGGAHATHGQVVAAQRSIRAAVALLGWLAARDLTLATAGQGDLEVWLASAAHPPRRRGELRPLGTKAQADRAGLRGHPVGQPGRHHRHRDPLGTSPLAVAR